MKLLFDPEALLEAQNAAMFYEESQPGLGKAFLASVEAAAAEIARRPTMWRPFKGRFRRYLIQRFPYGLIYSIDGNTIYVAATMHLKRKPGYWTARARKAS